MKSTVLTAILLITFTFVSAQNETIIVKGKVTDSINGSPLPGCTVMGNSSKGFMTGINGDYTIETERGKTLVFSCFGYKQKKINVTTAILNVILEPDEQLLNMDKVTVISMQRDGGRFTKKIEYNFLAPGWRDNPGYYNIKGKTDIEKLLFGETNAKLEFFVAPSFEGSYGFRIVRDSLNTSYLLELKRINNFDEVSSQLSKEYPSIGFPAEKISSVSKEEHEQARLHNNAMYEKQREERPKRYKVDTKYVPIKDDFSEKLYVKVVDAINNFKGKGIPPMINDGYEVTFRCVVEDEVWMLTIHMPKGYMGKLTDIFNQLIKDAEANSLDESKYISLLDKIEVK
jgi:hypothetical protein